MNQLKINDTNQVLNDIKELIVETKNSIQSNLNSEMVILYWNVGKRVRTAIMESEKAQYGKEIVDTLSRQLKLEYGRGYSRRNLFNMIKLYDMFPSEQKVQTLSAQLTWSHLILLMKYDDPIKIQFYISMVVNERWSVRALNERMNSMLYERTSLSKLPDETIINDIEKLKNEKKMSTEMFLRDPYVLDFLELRDTYSEKDLETSILKELESFMLEFGRDFTFVGRQVRITIGDKDYYIDLLFYHRKLKRLVLIELKLGEFLPEHKGQVELYLRWLDKNEKNEGEEPPIGIILCAEKATETVELLELDKSGIHVAQYLTQMPPKDVLEHKLHLAIQRAKLKLEESK
ncbi:PDDEXK nuclease domain-containing protein [Clostridiaceae bacterium HSG29]|nr:PDDEXK nuclease domain-containing protein [Clostridiaceae bacterium HSG29]